jgi:hypothetical protein
VLNQIKIRIVVEALTVDSTGKRDWPIYSLNSASIRILTELYQSRYLSLDEQ